MKKGYAPVIIKAQGEQRRFVDYALFGQELFKKTKAQSGSDIFAPGAIKAKAIASVFPPDSKMTLP